MHACEILPLLLCTDAWCLKLLASALGRLARRFSRASQVRAVTAARRPAYNPAERFLPCHRLSIGIPRI